MDCPPNPEGLVVKRLVDPKGAGAFRSMVHRNNKRRCQVWAPDPEEVSLAAIMASRSASMVVRTTRPEVHNALAQASVLGLNTVKPPSGVLGDDIAASVIALRNVYTVPGLQEHETYRSFRYIPNLLRGRARGAPCQNRTDDLFLTMETLCRLS